VVVVPKATREAVDSFTTEFTEITEIPFCVLSVISVVNSSERNHRVGVDRHIIESCAANHFDALDHVSHGVAVQVQ